MNIQDYFEEEEEEEEGVPKRKCIDIDECLKVAWATGIDEEMIPYIAELWLKGYETSQCCAGHVAERYFTPHIYWQTSRELSPEQFEMLEEIARNFCPDIKVDKGGISLVGSASKSSKEDKVEANAKFFKFLDEVLPLLPSKFD